MSREPRGPQNLSTAHEEPRWQAVRIGYTTVRCSLGRLLVAATKRGICAVSLGDSDAALEAAVLKEHPDAQMGCEHAGLNQWVSNLLDHLDGRQPYLDLPLDVKGTAFQWSVWEALRAIPFGSTRSYGEIARALERPSAARAVARACAANPVALVIPCHRALRGDGGLGGYRWGLERKKALLARESETWWQAGNLDPRSEIASRKLA